MAGRVVYTVMTGGYEVLLEQPATAGSSVDMVCLTDDPGLTSSQWKVRYVPPALPADPVRSARRMKILAHEYLPEYDESLYVDNTVLLKEKPETLLDELLPHDSPLAVVRHSFRGPVRDEFDAVVVDGLDTPWRCEEQRADYERVDARVLQEPTIWTGVMLRRHLDPAVRDVMIYWWENVLRYSRRDQLSFPIALSTAAFDPVVHDLDNHECRYYEWPRWVAGTERNRRTAWDVPGARIAELERHLASVEAQLASTESQLASVMAERDAYEEAVLALRHDNAVIQRDREILLAHAEDLGAEFAAEVRENEALRAEIGALRSSTSWRLTRPARAVTGLLGSARSGRPTARGVIGAQAGVAAGSVRSSKD